MLQCYTSSVLCGPMASTYLKAFLQAAPHLSTSRLHHPSRSSGKPAKGALNSCIRVLLIDTNMYKIYCSSMIHCKHICVLSSMLTFVTWLPSIQSVFTSIGFAINALTEGHLLDWAAQWVMPSETKMAQRWLGFEVGSWWKLKLLRDIWWFQSTLHLFCVQNGCSNWLWD